MKGGEALEETLGDETDLEKVLMKLGRTADELKADGKSAAWKLALAAALKARTTATNRWLVAALQLGNLQAVSRKVAQSSVKVVPLIFPLSLHLSSGLRPGEACRPERKRKENDYWARDRL